MNVWILEVYRFPVKIITGALYHVGWILVKENEYLDKAAYKTKKARL